MEVQQAPFRAKYRKTGKPSGLLGEAKTTLPKVTQTCPCLFVHTGIFCALWKGLLWGQRGRVKRNSLKSKTVEKVLFLNKNEWNFPCAVHPSYTSIICALFLLPQALSLSSAWLRPCHFQKNIAQPAIFGYYHLGKIYTHTICGNLCTEIIWSYIFCNS